MITVSADIKAAMAEYRILPVTLLSLHFAEDSVLSGAGGRVNITDAPSSITVGSITYQEASLGGVATPTVQSALDRDLYQIVLLDETGAWRSRVNAQPSGVLLEGSLIFLELDESGTLSNPGQSFTDPLSFYTGYLSGASLSYSGSTPELTMTFAGQLQQLSITRPRLTSQEEQQRFDPNDNSLNFAHFSETDDALKWGRT